MSGDPEEKVLVAGPMVVWLEVVDWEVESEGVVVSGDLGAPPQALKLSMDELGTALVTVEDDQVEYALVGGTVILSGGVTVGGDFGGVPVGGMLSSLGVVVVVDVDLESCWHPVVIFILNNNRYPKLKYGRNKRFA